MRRARREEPRDREKRSDRLPSVAEARRGEHLRDVIGGGHEMHDDESERRRREPLLALQKTDDPRLLLEWKREEADGEERADPFPRVGDGEGARHVSKVMLRGKDVEQRERDGDQREDREPAHADGMSGSRRSDQKRAWLDFFNESRSHVTMRCRIAARSWACHTARA